MSPVSFAAYTGLRASELAGPRVRDLNLEAAARSTAGTSLAEVRGYDLVDGVRFHDLRYSCATLLIAEGAHPKAVMERLGHSSVTVTLDRYGHLFPYLEEYPTDVLGRARSGALGSRAIAHSFVEHRLNAL